MLAELVSWTKQAQWQMCKCHILEYQWMSSLSPCFSHSFPQELLALSREEIRKCGEPQKLLASINV